MLLLMSPESMVDFFQLCYAFDSREHVVSEDAQIIFVWTNVYHSVWSVELGHAAPVHTRESPLPRDEKRVKEMMIGGGC